MHFYYLFLVKKLSSHLYSSEPATRDCVDHRVDNPTSNNNQESLLHSNQSNKDSIDTY